MSGAGRKHRAKHLTRQYLDSESWTGVGENEQLAVCLGSPSGQHVKVLVLSEPSEEQIVFLPGKFRKVIWLAIKDVIVVSGGTVVYKPSPDQINNLLKKDGNEELKKRVEEAQLLAIAQRPVQTQQPLYSAKVGQSTLSQLEGQQTLEPAVQNTNGVVELDPLSRLENNNNNRDNIRHRQQFFYGVDDDEEEEEEEEEENA
ncbi:hypothetical protein AGDE_01143 [Angomonas deanei]|uniref:S1-like domain-containing protein n=1 Tax=Angomonas deanei TaxID=59799 RepID=S9V615_9TRYP|nr:hypothetical protein AGDE_05437 [Angomonas deanei]EPY40511.1 hypothetical protein AGDE_03417 [Angomonas deanei]EPY42780.1 hypothetical protein AGDE_01143 [Angomonas deanei]CAD2215496.1 hypothetical protein, conserved [Angomonas deanei]|eukprot:EPY38492.1 hypothetical protein AGDE_05437 [Angomonas deanei]